MGGVGGRRLGLEGFSSFRIYGTAKIKCYFFDGNKMNHVKIKHTIIVFAKKLKLINFKVLIALKCKMRSWKRLIQSTFKEFVGWMVPQK